MPEDKPDTASRAERAPTRLARRIIEARCAVEMSQSQLAQRIGITRGAVGQWETGITEPSDANLRRVAFETGASYEWLATGRGKRHEGRGGPDLISSLPLGGTVEAGVFRTIELENKAPKPSEIRADLRYSDVPQYAWEVRGDSMNSAGIDDGMYIITATAEDFGERFGWIKGGSYVIVQRLREGGTEHELTVKQYLVHSPSLGSIAEAELRPCSTNKAHKSFFIRHRIPGRKASEAEMFGEPDNEGEIQIIGVVLSVVRLLNP
jgi:transcriptional regulator with XRE-family HTH domain